jgi:Tetratricopeptide repeat/Glycosyltransferase family 9 (heptosyltransferase)
MSSIAADERPGGPPQAAFAQAAALHGAGKFAEAEALLRDAIAAHPGSAILHNARGVMLAAMKRYRDAVWCYRAALARDPRAAATWTNLGNALTQVDHLVSAIACHQRAIALSRRDDPVLHRNLGVSLARAGRHGEAAAAYTRALALDPDFHMARWDRALAYLYVGQFPQGWADYEVRKLTGQLPARALPGTAWDGRPYAGKRLVLLSEQGFGDMLWVARYFARLKALGGELVIECRPELIPLIDRMGVADRLVPRGEPLPSADLHGHLCSLPGLFTPDLSSIPSAPYLTAPPDRAPKFTALFEPVRDRLKVGIVWSGSTTFGKNHRRAQRLMSFLQAFGLPGVQLFSLQKGQPAHELKSLPRGGPIIDLAPHLDDFADTAAAVAGLDLVIMTDSAVAHLAGALGKPVWLLLGHNAHWLWRLDRTDSPWYPSLRVFRPRAEGDWDHVFDAASAELMGLVNS